jgi:hypothetical protein
MVTQTDRKTCWVCEQPVTALDFRLDEFGFPVHKDCYDKLIQSRERNDRRNGPHPQDPLVNPSEHRTNRGNPGVVKIVPGDVIHAQAHCDSRQPLGCSLRSLG